MVMIDDDIFIDLLWNRAREFSPAEGYSDEFWSAMFDFLKETGWLSDPCHNNPMYIVDNIAVNGEFYTLEECYENGILEDGCEPNPDWMQFGDYYCTGHIGL